MDIQQFMRDLLESGEETAEEASKRRAGRLEEPLPYPAQLLKGMTLDPAIAAGRMAGGEVPYYLEEDLARTVYPGWLSRLTGGEPELEVFPRGSLNPAMPEGAADIAMNAPTSGLLAGAARGTVDRNLLGVNAPVDPQIAQYEQMIEDINKAFDEMQLPDPDSYNSWLEKNNLEPSPENYHNWAWEGDINPPPFKPWPSEVAQQAEAPTPPPLPMAKEAGDKQKLAQYLMSDAFVSPSGLTGKEVVANPYLVDTYTEMMMASPSNWASELTAAGVGHLVPQKLAPPPAEIQVASSNYAGEKYSGPGMEYNKLVDWIHGHYGGGSELPESEVEKMVDTIAKNPLHWGDQLKASGIDINQVADWVSLIPPAPIPNKFPWLPVAEPSTGGIITPYSGDFSAIREELYRRGLSQDPIMEMQRLTAGNTREGWREAADISDRLKGVLRGRPQDPYSIAVPHAIDTSRYGMSDWDEQAREMWERAREYNKEAIESPFGQEFNWDLPLYRGTRSATDQFMDPETKAGERGLFLADRPGPAGNYGRYMYPLVSRAKNPVEIDFQGRRYGDTAPGPWSSGDVNRHIEGARKAGNDLVIFRNLRDDDPSAPSGRSTQNQYVIFDPPILRSPFAQFNPARRHVSNLTAGFAGGINPFPFLSSEEERRRQQNGY